MHLVLAARHISRLRASSVTDQLREAARQLRVTLAATDCGVGLGVDMGMSAGGMAEPRSAGVSTGARGGGGGFTPGRRETTPVHMCLAWLWQGR